MWDEVLRKISAWGRDPRLILGCALAVAGLTMLACVLFSQDIYRDVANVYAYMARELGRGNWSEAHDPRIPMLNIVCAGVLCRIGCEAYTATIVVSGLFFILTIWPLYRLLCRFLAPAPAAWGALLYVLAPKMIRFAGSGLLESGRNLFVVLALLFLFRLYDTKKWRDAIWFGLALGGLTMARGEGIAVALVLLAAFGAGWVGWKRLPWGRGVALALLALGFWLLALVPSAYWNYRATGYPSPDHRIVEFFRPQEKAPVPAYLAREPESAWERVDSMQSGLVRGAYEPYLILALVGMLWLGWRRQWRMEYNLFLALILLHCLMYGVVVSSYRYYTVAIPLLMVFTVTALGLVARWLGQFPRLGWVLPVLFLVAAPLQVVNGLELVLRPESGQLQRVAAVVAAQRASFGPEVERLRLASIGMPEITFWSDSFPASGYGVRIYDWAEFQDFDLICVEAEDEHVLPVLLARGDLEELAHPDSADVKIFRKIRKAAE